MTSDTPYCFHTTLENSLSLTSSILNDSRYSIDLISAPMRDTPPKPEKVFQTLSSIEVQLKHVSDILHATLRLNDAYEKWLGDYHDGDV